MILLLKDDKRTKKVTKRTKKTRTLSMKYWLFHRDPYNGLVESPHHWNHIPSTTRTPFFSLLTFCRKIYSKSSTPADLTYILIHFVLLRLNSGGRLLETPGSQGSKFAAFFWANLGSPSIKKHERETMPRIQRTWWYGWWFRNPKSPPGMVLKPL